MDKEQTIKDIINLIFKINCGIDTYDFDEILELLDEEALSLIFTELDLVYDKMPKENETDE